MTESFNKFITAYIFQFILFNFRYGFSGYGPFAISEGKETSTEYLKCACSRKKNLVKKKILSRKIVVNFFPLCETSTLTVCWFLCFLKYKSRMGADALLKNGSVPNFIISTVMSNCLSYLIFVWKMKMFTFSNQFNFLWWVLCNIKIKITFIK